MKICQKCKYYIYLFKTDGCHRKGAPECCKYEREDGAFWAWIKGKCGKSGRFWEERKALKK